MRHSLLFMMLQRWNVSISVPQEALSSPIISASYSCNSQLVYASFTDGNIAVFDAESLRLRCRIAPSAYMPQPTPNSAPIIPQVIAASSARTEPVSRWTIKQGPRMDGHRVHRPLITQVQIIKIQR
ncbi:Topless family protein [Raphanus sativus]|nr:Topless family protein [Raphanus sativus]